MGQKVTLDLDVVPRELHERLAFRVVSLEQDLKREKSRLDAVWKDGDAVETRLDLLTERFDELAAIVAAMKQPKVSPPPPAAPVEADDPPPNNGPLVARACPKGATGVWLGMTKRQAEVLRIILGSIGGAHWTRGHTIGPAFSALESVQGAKWDIPGIGVDPNLALNYWHGHYAPEELPKGGV